MKKPSKKRLLVFTRYPIPGKTKTRLIPVLGETGAADLQRSMTEHILLQIKRFSEFHPLAVEMRYDGGDETKMKAWLGSDFCYRQQGDGDIGVRMKRAFGDAFGSGAEAVVLIGSDIPEITPAIIGIAFEQLKTHHLVLGPAKDGGYYLIGMQKNLQPSHVTALFSGMGWGHAHVLSRTMEKAKQCGLRFAFVDTLADVDRPDDLAVWEKVKRINTGNRPSPSISIIIPALNEEAHIARTIQTIGRGDQLEIIVVDGGSYDRTVRIAESLGARTVCGSPPRSRQMNLGAGEASGDVLLFLHADTLLPKHFEALVLNGLNQSGLVAGAFELGIDSSAKTLRWVERLAIWRSRRLKMPYGDQAIFLTSKIFHKMGGFPDLPIMEDFELIRRLGKKGKIAILPAAVRTSPRRWENLGTFTVTLINQFVIAAYLLGVSPDTIDKWYRRRKGVRRRPI
ncbi:TIGR04283 family arsenosugar biosynthesis glycosyltransferase [Thermodesulfobacteriota bacterium]